jgi:hypothetical protein
MFDDMVKQLDTSKENELVFFLFYEDLMRIILLGVPQPAKPATV